MWYTKDAELLGTDEYGPTLGLGRGVTCRVLVLTDHIVRVVFLREGALRQPRTWMVLPRILPPPRGPDDTGHGPAPQEAHGVNDADEARHTALPSEGAPIPGQLQRLPSSRSLPSSTLDTFSQALKAKLGEGGLASSAPQTYGILASCETASGGPGTPLSPQGGPQGEAAPRSAPAANGHAAQPAGRRAASQEGLREATSNGHSHVEGDVDGRGQPPRDVPWEGRRRMDLSGFPPVRFSLEEAEGTLRLRTRALTLEVRLKPFRLKWLDAAGTTTIGHDRDSCPYGFSQRSGQIMHAMHRHPGDAYFGLGDKTGALNLHGRRLRTVMTDALGYDARNGDPLYKHWPFMLVRNGESGTAYGIFYDNMAAAALDLGCAHSNYYGLFRTYEANDGDLDYYFMAGPRIRDITSRFLRLTGRMPVPPRWSLGYACTAMSLADAPDAQQQIEEFIAQCGRHRIPCSAFHLGSGYGSIGKKRYTFNWNRDKFPDPQGLMGAFRGAGMRVAANCKPCLLDDHPAFAGVAKAGAFVPSRPGGPPSLSQFWDGEGAHLDFTNPAAIAWWQAGCRAALFGMGVDSVWNDNNEWELWDEEAVCAGFGEPIPLDLARPLQPLLMTRASFEETARHRPGERAYTITRAGCPGSQRYAQTWSGDNSSEWGALRFNLRTGLNMSLSGLFNVGHDVGGFAGPSPGPELFVRWVQTGLLHPRFIMNSWKAGAPVTTPWLHPGVMPLVRAAIRLRYRLMPYLYSTCCQAAEADTPIVRPTFWEYDSDPRCFEENTELMLGPSLLAAPVLEEGARQRSVYLPRGPACWYDAYSEESFAAGAEATVAAPLGRLPLFAPAGAMVCFTAEHADFSRLHDEPSRCLRLFPPPGAGTSCCTLYEDDGLSHEYLSPCGRQRLHFEMACSASTIELRLECEGAWALPFSEIMVAVPAFDCRLLQLRTVGPGPRLTRGHFHMHAL